MNTSSTFSHINGNGVGSCATNVATVASGVGGTPSATALSDALCTTTNSKAAAELEYHNEMPDPMVNSVINTKVTYNEDDDNASIVSAATSLFYRNETAADIGQHYSMSVLNTSLSSLNHHHHQQHHHHHNTNTNTTHHSNRNAPPTTTSTMHLSFADLDQYNSIRSLPAELISSTTSDPPNAVINRRIANAVDAPWNHAPETPASPQGSVRSTTLLNNSSFRHVYSAAEDHKKKGNASLSALDQLQNSLSSISYQHNNNSNAGNNGSFSGHTHNYTSYARAGNMSLPVILHHQDEDSSASSVARDDRVATHRNYTTRTTAASSSLIYQDTDNTIISCHGDEGSESTTTSASRRKYLNAKESIEEMDTTAHMNNRTAVRGRGGLRGSTATIPTENINALLVEAETLSPTPANSNAPPTLSMTMTLPSADLEDQSLSTLGGDLTDCSLVLDGIYNGATAAAATTNHGAQQQQKAMNDDSQSIIMMLQSQIKTLKKQLLHQQQENLDTSKQFLTTDVKHGSTKMIMNNNSSMASSLYNSVKTFGGNSDSCCSNGNNESFCNNTTGVDDSSDAAVSRLNTPDNIIVTNLSALKQNLRTQQQQQQHLSSSTTAAVAVEDDAAPKNITALNTDLIDMNEILVHELEKNIILWKQQLLKSSPVAAVSTTNGVTATTKILHQ